MVANIYKNASLMRVINWWPSLDESSGQLVTVCRVRDEKGTSQTLKIVRLDRVMKVKQTGGDGVKYTAIEVDERVHFCFVAVAQVPPGQCISSVQQDRTSNMTYYQDDVQGSTDDLDYPGKAWMKSL